MKITIVWRKWHRWIGLVAAIFLVLVSVTGILLQWQQFFGEEEAEKEKSASLVSKVQLTSPPQAWLSKIALAEAAISKKLGNAPVNKIEFVFQSDEPKMIFHLGGAEAKRVDWDLNKENISSIDDDVSESFLLRLHTGEVFGDGGLVLGMLWGLSLLILTISGIVLYWQMYKKRANLSGGKKVFW